MNRSGAMLLRGMRWRLAGSILTVLITAVAVGSAVFGPLFLQAGGDSLVRGALAAASDEQSGLTLTPAPGHPTSLNGLATEQSKLIRVHHLGHVLGSPIDSVAAGVHLLGPGPSPFDGQVVSRSGICSVLHVRSGTCGLGADDAVITARSAHSLGVVPGQTITVTTPKGSRPVHLRVTGIVGVPDLGSDYWFGAGAGYFPFGIPTGGAGAPHLIQLDDVFVSAATAESLGSAYAPSPMIQLPLTRGSIGLGNARSTENAVNAATSSAVSIGFSLSTGLPALLHGALHQHSLMGTIVAVAAIQLALLALWVLSTVLLRSADLRRSELRVARLRGFPPASMLAVTVTEPALLCGLGVVIGAVAGWVAVLIVTPVLFISGTAVTLGIWVLVGFAGAVLTIGGALALSALRLLRGSGLERSTAAPGGVTSRARAITDVTLLVLAAVALVAAGTSGGLASHSNPIAAAAPAVVALGASVIAIRAVELACRRASRATLDSSRVATFLAVRQIARRPAALRESRTLVIAVCLACVAVSAWSVARTNRSTAATFSLGAPTVVTVTPHGTGLTQAVARVDPRGRFAMAAAQVTSLTQTQDLLAVDASRLAAVASWPAGISRASLAQVGRALAPPGAPQVNLAGTGDVSLSADVTVQGALAKHLHQLELGLWAFNPVNGTTIIDLGQLVSGTHTYVGSQDPCPGGCRVVGVGLVPTTDGLPVGGSASVSMSAFAEGPSSGLSTSLGALKAADWRSTVGGVTVSRASAGVTFTFPAIAVVGYEGASGDGTPPMASIADAPLILPTAAGAEAEKVALESGESGRLNLTGLDGSPVTVRPVITASALPRVGSAGQMVDLSELARLQISPTELTVSQQVWLGSKAPADAVSRLRAAGLTIDSVQRASGLVRQGRHTGPALAYDFMLLAAIVALLTAAVSSFGGLIAGLRQRATELTSLEVSGIPRAVLVRALAVEAAITATTVLFGVGAGVLSGAIAIPSLPQLAAPSAAPLTYALPVLLIVAVAACAVLVVFAATGLATRGIIARMSPSLLRAAAYDTD